MKKQFLFINSFVLKIVAFLLMTLDHIGIFLVEMESDAAVLTGEVFRLFGRFAFPLFVLMLVEGVRHTHSFAKYALRLGIVASIVLVAQAVIIYCFDSSLDNAYSPLLDLLCYGTILYLLSRKDRFSFLSIIPFALVIGSFAVGIYELNSENTVIWFPIFLRSGYNIFGLIMALVMFYSYPLLKKFFESYHMDEEGYETSTRFRFYLNILFSFAVFFAVVVIYLIAKIPNCDLFMVNAEFYSETWALLAIPIILLYSGKLGYKSKWFQYASYLYFPLHLVIIYLAFYLIGF